MVVVKQLASEFKVQLSAELGNALQYSVRLEGEILVVIESIIKHYKAPVKTKSYIL